MMSSKLKEVKYYIFFFISIILLISCNFIQAASSNVRKGIKAVKVVKPGATSYVFSSGPGSYFRHLQTTIEQDSSSPSESSSKSVEPSLFPKDKYRYVHPPSGYSRGNELLKNEIEKLKQSYEKLQNENQSLSERLKLLEVENKSLQERLDSFSKKSNSFTKLKEEKKELRKKENELSQRESELSQKENELLKRERSLANMETVFAQKERNLVEKEKRLDTLEVAINSKKEMIASKESEITEKEKTVLELETKFEKREKQLMEEISVLKKENFEIKQSLDANIGTKKNLESEIEALKNQIRNFRSELEECNKKKNEFFNQINEVQNKRSSSIAGSHQGHSKEQLNSLIKELNQKFDPQTWEWIRAEPRKVPEQREPESSVDSEIKHVFKDLKEKKKRELEQFVEENNLSHLDRREQKKLFNSSRERESLTGSGIGKITRFTKLYSTSSSSSN